MTINGQSSEPYIAAVDLGASNGRIVLGRFCGDGLELETFHRFEHRAAARDGYLRWDWPAIRREVLRGLKLAAQAAAPVPILSVSCCAWAQDFGLVDGEGRLIFEPVSYRDPRTGEAFRRVTDLIPPRELVRRVGSVSAPMTTLIQLRAMADREPEALKAAARMLFMADCVHHELCGAGATDTTLATAGQLVSLEAGGWDRALLQMLGIPDRLLPTLHSGAAELGPVTVAALLPELGATRVLVTAGHDTAAAVSVTPSDNDAAFLSSGTWSMIGGRVSKPEISDSLMTANWALLGLADGDWGLLEGLAGLWLIQECRRSWKEAGTDLSHADVVELARPHVPALSLIDPEWPGFQAPADMPGAIARFCRETGQRAPASVGEIAATIFTSLALDYRCALDELAQATGRFPKTLWIVGGGTRNGLLNQLTADAAGIQVIVGPCEATALGNLLLQARFLGIVGDEEQQTRTVASVAPPRRIEPQGDWVGGLYRRFREIKDQA